MDIHLTSFESFETLPFRGTMLLRSHSTAALVLIHDFFLKIIVNVNSKVRGRV
jgi:hypothetical protein